jgi:hypothetical protein
VKNASGLFATALTATLPKGSFDGVGAADPTFD